MTCPEPRPPHVRLARAPQDLPRLKPNRAIEGGRQPESAAMLLPLSYLCAAVMALAIMASGGAVWIAGIVFWVGSAVVATLGGLAIVYRTERREAGAPEAAAEGRRVAPLMPALAAVVLLGTVLGASGAVAQSAVPRWTSTPIGMDGARASAGYKTPSRDAQGNRIIVNGRRVDLSNDRDIAPGSLASNNPGVAGGIGRLARPGATATSIGNSISISRVRNSTIVVEQRNWGQQISTVGAGSN